MFTREVNENISYTAFRIVVSFLFIQHGLAKYIEFPLSMTNGNGSVEIASLYGIAGIIEILFGSLVLIGFLTRISAFMGEVYKTGNGWSKSKPMENNNGK